MANRPITSSQTNDTGQLFIIIVMSKIQRIIEFTRWPIVTGLLAALVITMFFPRLLPQQMFPEDPAGDYASLMPQENDWRGPVSYAKAVQRAAPAVVNIYTSKKINRNAYPSINDPRLRGLFSLFDEPEQQHVHSALGSGVIVSKEGYLLTNNHVITGADEIIVALQDGRDARAQLIGVNQESDLAVLKIDLENLVAIPLGSPERVQVGDVVLAIGNPFGMGQSVTQGIVSATRRRGLKISLFEDFIQTDAAINPGNSGGALVDAHGNLLGINTAQFSQNTNFSGFGFAIPADTALQTLRDIVEYGHVVHGWLGIDTVPFTSQAAQTLNMGDTQGIWITKVFKDSPADTAGLLEKDVITHINKRAVGVGIWAWQEVAESRPGEAIEIRILRGGEILNLEAIVGTSPEQTRRTARPVP